MKYKKFLILGLIFFLLPIVTSPLYAQSFSMSLNPEKHEVISRPGQTITLPYSLSNLGDPQIMSFKVYTLTALDNTGNYKLDGFEDRANSPKFAVINSAMELGKPFLMNGKSTVLFDVEITIPETAAKKDYYITFVAESQGIQGGEGMSSIQLEGGVGSHILLTVTDSGQIDHSAQIALFDIPDVPSIKFNGEKYAIVDSNKSIPFTLTIANTGNNYIKTKGVIQTSAGTALKLPESTILSGAQKEISSIPNQCVPNNSSECSKLLTNLSSRKLLGIEKVIATVQVGDSQVLYANANLIVLPIKLLITLALIFITAFSVYFFLKNKERKLLV